MKKKYSTTLPMLKEMFPDWTDDDLVFALEDADGDVGDAAGHITEGLSSSALRIVSPLLINLTDVPLVGNVSQWGEVKKKTADRARPKAKEVQSTVTETTTVSGRGGRGRGGLESRGRARGDRGRAARGGRAGAHTNGTRMEKPSVSTTVNVVETTVSSTAPDTGALEKSDKRVESATTEQGDAKEASKSSVIPEGTKNNWASLFAKPAAPPQKKPATIPPVPVPEKASEPATQREAPELAAAPVSDDKTPEATVSKPVAPPVAPSAEQSDDLTRTNLEQIPDVSAPAPTATTASTIGSAHDPNHTGATGTPTRGVPSAYTPSALRQSARAPGFQRRVMEQQEAVVMPGNHAVDRAAVQFGSMGLNGDAADANIDQNREQAETRAQPPQHSPVAPRASLPPSTQSQTTTETSAVPRPAPGLPPVPQATAADTSFTDFARYADPQKPYDPFSQQVTQPQPQLPEPFANQAPVQPTATTGSEYSPFYAVDQRLPYNYYATYGQSQDATLAQRAAAGFGVSAADMQPQVPTTQPPSRYGHVEAPSSGHNTPNPTLPGATQAPTAAQMPTAHGYGGYGYPYYSNPHYASYMSQMNQHQYGRNRPMYDDARRYDDHYMPHTTQYGYGSQYGPYGKAGMYGQPHAFSYDHASSPAAAASFNQTMPGRESAYGRTGSAQPENQQSAAGANAFGAGMDVFGRTQAGFGQNQPIAQQPPVTAEETKGFDTPKGAGPSPSLAQANRPGSATNNVPGQPQAQGLPPLQAQQGQQGFGGYPHLNPQYGGLGALGGHQAAATQAHQASGYGNYAGTGFGNYYGNTRGGWGGNYGH